MTKKCVFFTFLRLIDKKLTESEAAQRITENFGYTEAMANNIVKISPILVPNKNNIDFFTLLQYNYIIKNKMRLEI